MNNVIIRYIKLIVIKLKYIVKNNINMNNNLNMNFFFTIRFNNNMDDIERKQLYIISKKIIFKSILTKKLMMNNNINLIIIINNNIMIIFNIINFLLLFLKYIFSIFCTISNK